MTPPAAPTDGATPDARPRVEFRWRWLAVVASLVILLILREHKIALLAYGGLVVVSLLGALVWGPRRAVGAERRFTREALRHLSAGDRAALEALARRQWLMRAFGRRHVVAEMRALAATTAEDHTTACALYRDALEHAPPSDRPRIELNLARGEEALGQLTAAEGRYRGLLSRQPGFSAAIVRLGLLLARRRETAQEALELLHRAVSQGDPRELPALLLAKAEALAHLRDPRAAAALEAAARAGANPADVQRVASLTA